MGEKIMVREVTDEEITPEEEVMSDEEITPEEEAIELCQKQAWAEGLSRAMIGREAPVEIRVRLKEEFCRKLIE